jgi:hypothetical protein
MKQESSLVLQKQLDRAQLSGSTQQKLNPNYQSLLTELGGSYFHFSYS